MDNFFESHPNFILGMLIASLLFVVAPLLRGKKTPREQDRLRDWQAKYKDKKVFLCEGDEEVSTNVTQLYGYPVNTGIREGMKLIDHRGVQYTIKEVYADDATPDTPDKEINELSGNCAIVVETSHWDSKGF